MNDEQLRDYFTRVGYRERAQPDERTLRSLMAAHVTTIPFENIDVLLGRGISLGPDDVFRKLVCEKRGGYCFEHNSLFARVLHSIGFHVRPLAARARIGRSPSETPPRTHLCLEVTLNEKWLVDVGVGGYSPKGPLRFVPEVAQAAGDETRRLILRDKHWLHQIHNDDDWFDVSELTGESMPSIDQEVSNWFTSTHPDSIFKKEFMLALAHPSGRTTLRGRHLTIRANGQKQELVLENASALAKTLDAHFGLTVEPLALEQLWEKGRGNHQGSPPA